MNEKELRNIIDEITAEVLAESSIDPAWVDPGDGEFTEEEAQLLQQLSADAAKEESLEGDDAEEKNSRDAILANETDGKLSFDNWSSLVVSASTSMNAVEDIEDSSVFGMPYDAWLNDVDPGEYAMSIDEAGVWSDERDYNAGFFRESKEFTFDKFMKDINSREEKISQNKKELTENDGDANARLRQKLYQEDWRNSVKFRGNK